MNHSRSRRFTESPLFRIKKPFNLLRKTVINLDMKQVSLTLKPVAPFRLDYTVWALRRRPENIVDTWEGRQYRRVFHLNKAVFYVSVNQPEASGQEDPLLEVKIKGERISAPDVKTIGRKLTRILGLNIELPGFYEMAKKDRFLGPLANEFYGLKPPRFGSIFEALINAVACQQLSLLVGITLLNRLAQAYGEVFLMDGGRWAYSFPSPAALADAGHGKIRALGFSGHKADTIIEISCITANGRRGASRFDMEAAQELPDEEAENMLSSLKGIGRWSAQYVLLRGMGRLGVFPGDDVGARAKLRQWLGIEEPLDYAAVRRIAARWHPYGGFIYFHLLLKNLKSKGLILLSTEKKEVYA